MLDNHVISDNNIEEEKNEDKFESAKMLPKAATGMDSVSHLGKFMESDSRDKGRIDFNSELIKTNKFIYNFTLIRNIFVTLSFGLNFEIKLYFEIR